MSKKYILLIDESGDQGLDRVMTHSNRFGASSYLTMGAALVPSKLAGNFRDALNELKAELAVNELHCTDLNHAQVAFFSRRINDFRVLCFGVISKKSTLGSYQEKIAGDEQAQDYYNKCSQYLVELVASYCGLKKISADEVEIIFEKKRGHDYGRLQRFLQAISRKPIDARAAKLTYLEPFSISALSKQEEPLLAISDCIAYALHKAFCSENNRLRLTEQRYLRELKNKFFCDEKTSQIANNGIKFIKGPIAMGLKGEDLKFAMKFYKKAKIAAKRA